MKHLKEGGGGTCRRMCLRARCEGRPILGSMSERLWHGDSCKQYSQVPTGFCPTRLKLCRLLSSSAKAITWWRLRSCMHQTRDATHTAGICLGKGAFLLAC